MFRDFRRYLIITCICLAVVGRASADPLGASAQMLQPFVVADGFFFISSFDSIDFLLTSTTGVTLLGALPDERGNAFTDFPNLTTCQIDAARCGRGEVINASGRFRDPAVPTFQVIVPGGGENGLIPLGNVPIDLVFDVQPTSIQGFMRSRASVSGTLDGFALSGEGVFELSMNESVAGFVPSVAALNFGPAMAPVPEPSAIILVSVPLCALALKGLKRVSRRASASANAIARVMSCRRDANSQ
jgi:hypothetical protein